MGLLKRPVCVGIAAVAALAPVTMTGALAATAAAAAPKSGPQFATLKDSFAPTANARSGTYLSSRMSVELILAPRNESGQNNELRAAYTKGSSGYHKWLAKGQFDARYAPTKAERGAVQCRATCGRPD